MRFSGLNDGLVAQRERSNGVVLLTTCALALVATLITYPRPTTPQVLPLPRFDPRALAELDRREHTLGQSAMDGSLPNATRAVGEQVRRLGLRTYQRANIASTEYASLARDVRALLKAGRDQELLRLRALQAELFVQATHESARRGSPLVGLQELGAEFAHLLFRGWVDDQGACILPDATLRLMFRSHFARLIGLDEHPRFRQSLQELRLYYSTLLEFPPLRGSDPTVTAQLQLRYAQSLGRVDPSFDPRPLLGVLHFRLHQYEKSIQLFEQFLRESPNAPYSHLVRGHLQLSQLRFQVQHLGAP